jgi:cerevisin
MRFFELSPSWRHACIVLMLLASTATSSTVPVGTDLATEPAVAGNRITILKQRPEDDFIRQYGIKVDTIANMYYLSGDIPADIQEELEKQGLISYVHTGQVTNVEAALPAGVVQENPPSWGLDRIDQKSSELDHKFAYPASAGEGVNVYVLDSGVSMNNPDLKGRVTWGAAFGPGANDGQIDDLGHGTFVAGVIAGEKFGVAKKAHIISVKIYRKQGDQSMNDFLQGISWVLEDYRKRGNKKAIINISSGAPYDQTLNNAVQQLVNAGIIVVTSAGNSGEQNVPFDSCQHSPSSASGVISVGATDREDKVASFSNTGRCVTLFAPGVDVESIGITPGQTVKNSGTSFSTPYVTGVVALMLSENGPMSPAQVKERLVSTAHKGVVKGLNSGNGAPNLLLNGQLAVGTTASGQMSSDSGAAKSGGHQQYSAGWLTRFILPLCGAAAAAMLSHSLSF